MKRRSFLKASSIISLPIAFGGIQVSALAKSRMFHTSGDGDRVLVLVQLNGGNDGLNTLIPLDQYDNLSNARGNIILPSSKLLNITNTNAFHPSMTGMQALYNDGKMNIVQNVSYPNQNRSHFRSTDIWHSASDADKYLDTGWYGRYLDSIYPSYPEGFPNDENTDPFAISLGYQVSETCQGLNSNFSIALKSPDELKNLGDYEGDLYQGTCYGDELTFVRNEIKKTNAYSQVVIDASDNGENLSSQYADDSNLSEQLKIVARLISGGLKTRVYVVTLGGFDTHSAQVESGDVSLGKHATLLKDLSDSIAAFQDDLSLLGLDKRVVGMTYSEFGRKIKSNASLGTDHGTAAPMFVFGNCVVPDIIGDNPEIISDVDPKSGVAMQYDFRSVYGSILMDWFEVSEEDVKLILHNDFQYINILSPCDVDATISTEKDISLRVFPNPTNDTIQISFISNGSNVKISIYDVLGHEVDVVASQKHLSGETTISHDVSKLISGQYIIRIIGTGVNKIAMFVKG